MSNYILFFKQEAKRLLKGFENNDANSVTRVDKYIKQTADMCLARAQHVVAKEAGFNNWQDLIHASDDQLLFAKIMYQYPLLTEIGGWSYPGHRINPYSDEDRHGLFNSYERVMRIVRWLRANAIDKPQNTRDYEYVHTGTTKDFFSRLFEKMYKEPYEYTGAGILTAAMLMCGFKTSKKLIPGQGRCYFIVSRRDWERACQQSGVR